MDELLECPICNNQYDSKTYIPKFVECGNGHTICLICCQDIYKKKDKTQFQCPFDNQPINLSPKKLQTNLIVLQMLDNINSTEQKCAQHNEVNIIYCKSCEMQICFKCIIYTEHKSHEVAEIKEVYQEFFEQANQLYDIVQQQKQFLQEQILNFELQKQKLKSQVYEYQEEMDCAFQNLLQHIQVLKEQRVKQVKEESEKIINSFDEANIAIQKRILQMNSVQKPEKKLSSNKGNIEQLISFIQDPNVKSLAFKSVLPEVSFVFKFNTSQENLIEEIYKNLYTFQLMMYVQQVNSQSQLKAQEFQEEDSSSKAQENEEGIEDISSPDLKQRNQNLQQDRKSLSAKHYNKGYKLIERMKQKQQLIQSNQKKILQNQGRLQTQPTPSNKTRSKSSLKKQQDLNQMEQQSKFNLDQENENNQSRIYRKKSADFIKSNFLFQRSPTFQQIQFQFKEDNIENENDTINTSYQDQSLASFKIKQKSSYQKKKIEKKPFQVELSLSENYSIQQFLPGEKIEIVWSVKNLGTTKLPSCSKLVKQLKNENLSKEQEVFNIGELEPQKSIEVYVVIEIPNNVGSYNYEFQVYIDENKLGNSQSYNVNVTKDFLLISDKQYSKHLNFYNSLQDKKPFKLLFDKKNVECFWSIYDEG